MSADQQANKESNTGAIFDGVWGNAWLGNATGCHHSA